MQTPVHDTTDTGHIQLHLVVGAKGSFTPKGPKIPKIYIWFCIEETLVSLLSLNKVCSNILLFKCSIFHTTLNIGVNMLSNIVCEVVKATHQI